MFTYNPPINKWSIFLSFYIEILHILGDMEAIFWLSTYEKNENFSE